MRVPVAVVVVLGLVGPVIAQQGSRASNAAIAQAAPDPVQEFEKIVKRCQTSVEAKNTPAISVYHNSRTSSWVRRVRSFEVRYDVKKTDSLVAPIVGQINVLEVAATGTAADEAGAAALNFTIASSPRHVRQRYDATFTWRDQNWFFKDGTSTLDFRHEDGNYGNTMKSAIDASKGVGHYGPVAECFPS